MARKGFLVLVLAAFALLGCEPGYERTSFTNVSYAPAPAAMQERGIQISHGVSVRALLTPYNDSDEVMPIADDDFDVRSESGRFVRVERGPSGREFVFSGVAVGTDAVIVSMKGKNVDRIDVTVLPQE